MAYEKLGLANGVTLKSAHLKHIEEGIENAAETADNAIKKAEEAAETADNAIKKAEEAADAAGYPLWRNIKGKPTYSTSGGHTVTWDGNIAGHVYIDAGDGALVKVSDAVPTMVDFANGATIVVVTDEGESSTTVPAEQWIKVTDYVWGVANGIYIAAVDGAVLNEVVFPERGVYFIALEDSGYVKSLTISGYTGFGAEEILRPSVLPEALRFGDVYISGGDTLMWDGSAEHCVAVHKQDYEQSDGTVITAYFYQLSDAAPTLEELQKGGYVSMTYAGESASYKFDETCLQVSEDGNSVSIVITETNDAGGTTLHWMGAVFLNEVEGMPKGVYQLGDGGDISCEYILQINGYCFPVKTYEKPIDTKYLPKALQFGEMDGDTLTWDGDTTGLESYSEGGIVIYKMSDATPTADDFANGFTIIYDNNGTQTTISVTAEEMGTEDITNLISNGILGLDAVFIAYEGNALGITPGTYFINSNGCFTQSFTINGYTGFGGVKKIDEKYLPGANVLYVDIDTGYLYKTSDITNADNRITADELMAMFFSGNKLIVCIGLASDTLYCNVVMAGMSGAYAVAVVFMGDTVLPLYTAEYTPPETTGTETT